MHAQVAAKKGSFRPQMHDPVTLPVLADWKVVAGYANQPSSTLPSLSHTTHPMYHTYTCISVLNAFAAKVTSALTGKL